SSGTLPGFGTFGARRIKARKGRGIRGGQAGQLVTVPAHRRPGFRAGRELQRAVAIENTRWFQALEDKTRLLAAASRHKSEFLASMSHELRTPLNAIIGYSEMLQEEAEDRGHDALLPDLQKIQAASQHLLRLINDILDLSKVEAGKLELRPEAFELLDALTGVQSVVKPLADRKHQHLLLDAPDDLGQLYH